MRINVINYELGFNDGILSKFANKTNEQLIKLGHDSYITAIPEGESDIRYHINYLPYQHDPEYKGKNVLNITHIFDGYKLDAIRKAMETADLGICMSNDTKYQLIKWGLPKDKLTTILPAHDGKPRRHQIVSILTNVYPDGCKREEMFTELVKTLDNRVWAFRIMGKDWSEILIPLVAEGLQVDYFAEFDVENHQKILESSDYSLYFGVDEGSMGILDAKNAGLKIIAPPVGFNRDIGIDYPFNSQEELNKIFAKLSINPVADWTWEKYAKQHIKVWKKLLK